MNPIDFLIIYLAGGAPFGVYYFLKNRARLDLKTLCFKSFLTFLVWMPLALLLARRNFAFKSYITGFGEKRAADSVQKKNIVSIQKDLERMLIEIRFGVSVYEFRETVERYVGLTLAERNGARQIAEHEKEIFLVAPTEKIELGAICLHRRNRKRLSFHRIAARADFLRLIGRMSKSVSDKNELRALSIALTEITQDFEARDELERMFAGSMQSVAGVAGVKNAEKDLWKPETRQPPTARLISPLPAVKATMNLRRKD